jgi:hypothetical protein
MFAKSQQAVFLKALISLKKIFLHIIVVYYTIILLKLVSIIHYFCVHHIRRTILGLEKSPKSETKKLEETAEKAS